MRERPTLTKGGHNAGVHRDKYLTSDEFKRLLEAARTRRHRNALRDYTLLAVAGLTGLRPIELIKATFGELALDDTPSWLRIVTAKQRMKSLRRDTVLLPPTATEALKRYLGTRPGRDMEDRLFPLSTRQVGRLFRYYAKLAGLNRAYSVKALRHFRGLRLYEQTKDPQLVKDQLRHRRMSSTEVYIHTVARERAAEVDV